MFKKAKHTPIERLAIRYAAYREASLLKDDNGIACWGEMLLEIQEQLEVDLVDVKNTKALIQYALNRLAREAA